MSEFLLHFLRRGIVSRNVYSQIFWHRRAAEILFLLVVSKEKNIFMLLDSYYKRPIEFDCKNFRKRVTK